MKRYSRACLVLILTLLHLPGTGRAQAVDPTFQPCEVYKLGSVKSIAADGNGGAWILGTFDLANGAGLTDLAHFGPDGQLDPTYQAPAFDASTRQQLRSIQVLPSGKVLLLGDGNLTVGSHTTRNLMLLQANGQPDVSFVPANFFTPSGYRLGVTAAAQADGKLLVGGDFTNYNNSGWSGLVRLLPSGQLDPTFTPPGLRLQGIRTLSVLADGAILVGGVNLQYTGARPGAGLTRLRPDGSLDPTFMATNPLSVWEMVVQPNGQILIGGHSSNEVAPGKQGSILRLQASGAADLNFVPINVAGRELARNGNASADRHSRHFALLTDGSILAAYAPTTVGGSSQLEHYQASGLFDTGWLPTQPAGEITALATLPANLALLGGTLTSLAGQGANVVGIQGTTGKLSSTWRPALYLPGSVKVLARQADGRLLVGGDFRLVNGWESPNVARLWPSGIPDTTFMSANQGVEGGEIQALAVDGSGRVLLGGSFQTVNGKPRVGTARLLANGRLDAGYAVTVLQSSGGTPVVRAIQVQPDGKVLLVGSFVASQPNGPPSPQVVRVLDTGAMDATFTAAIPFSGQAGALQLLPTGELLVAGNFYSNRLELVRRLLPNGSLDPAFNIVLADPTLAGIGQSLTLETGGSFLLAGSFARSNNQFAANITRLNANGTTNSSFVSALPNYPKREQVVAVAPESSGAVVVAVQPEANTTTFDYLQRLLPSGQRDAAYFGGPLPGPDGPVSALLRLPDGSLLVGGSFRHIAGSSQLGLARLLDSGTPTAATGAQAQPTTELWPNPARGTIVHVAVDITQGAHQVQLLNLLGQTLVTQAVRGPEVLLPTAALAPGVYLVRVQYATTTISRRIVLQ